MHRILWLGTTEDGCSFAKTSAFAEPTVDKMDDRADWGWRRRGESAFGGAMGTAVFTPPCA